jgi:hypothetical protein
LRGADTKTQPKRFRTVARARSIEGSDYMYIGIGGLILLIILLVILF